MPKFKDSTGREWSIEIPNFGTVVKLRKETGLDLNKVGFDSAALVEVLVGDGEQLLAAVWTLIGPQSPATTFDQFIESIDSEALDAAKLATIDAVFDFFHRGRAAAGKSLLREIQIKMASGSSGSDGSLVASAASAPASTRSEN